jgi:hypothetical protein
MSEEKRWGNLRDDKKKKEERSENKGERWETGMNLKGKADNGILGRTPDRA